MVSSLKGFAAWTALAKFYSYQESSMILPVCLALVYYLVPRRGAGLIGCLLAFGVASLLVNVDLVSAVLAAVGAGMMFLECPAGTIEIGLVPFMLTKVAFICHPLICSVHAPHLKVFFLILSLLPFLVRNSKDENNEEEESGGKWDWIRAGVWLFLAKHMVADARLSITAAVIFFVISLNVQLLIEKFPMKKLDALLCILGLVGNIAGSAIGAEYLGGCFIFCMQSRVNLKRKEWWKALLLFCKLSTLSSHIPSDYKGILLPVLLTLYAVVASLDQKSLQKEKDKSQKWLLIVLGVVAIGSRFYQTTFPPRIVPLKLDELRVENVPSEAAYLVQEDFEGLPLLRVGMFKDQQSINLDLIRALQLDVLVSFNQGGKEASDLGRILGESGGFHSFDSLRYSVISRYPIVKKQNGHVHLQVQEKRTVKLLIAEAVNKDSARWIREEAMKADTAILLASSPMLVNTPDYHLVFRPSVLNPAIHPRYKIIANSYREALGTLHDIDSKTRERNGLHFAHNNRAVIPVNYGRLRAARGEWHLSTWALLPPKVIDADVKWRRLVETVKTLVESGGSSKAWYWSRWVLPEKDILCKGQKNREECPYYYHLNKILF